MAHEIEVVNGMARMAYAGEKPWHGLGTEVSPDLTPAEMLIAAGLNWSVRITPLWTKTTQYGARRTALGKMLYRVEDGQELSICGPEYVPTQNIEAFTFFKRFVEAGHMKMETAGSLQGGRRIWGLANIQDSFELAGGDKVTGYLLVSSPHIYGESLQIRFVATRVVCDNTLSMAMREKQGSTGRYRMLHVKSFDVQEMRKAEDALGIAKSLLGEFKSQAKILAAAPASKSQIAEYVMRLFDPKLLNTIQQVKERQELAILGASEETQVAELERLVGMGPKSLGEWAQEKANRATRKVLAAIDDAPGAEMKSAAGTWWGALNGVTYCVDHTSEYGGISYDQDAMLTSAWLGQRAGLKERALEMALEYAEKS